MKFQTFLSGVMLGFNMVLGFAVATMLVWLMGASGFGMYTYVFVLFATVSVVIQLGIPRLAVRETARALTLKDFPLMKAFWNWAGIAVLGFSLSVTALAFILVWFFGDPFPMDQKILIGLGALSVPLATLGALRGSILRGLGHVVLGQLPETGLRNLFFALGLLIFLLVGLELSPAGAMGLNLTATALAFAIGAWFLLARIPPDLKTASAQSPIPSAQWWKAATFMGVSVGMNQINNYADLLILQLYRPAEDLGIYRIIYQMSMFVGFGVQAVTLVFSPRFAGAHAKQDLAGLQHLVAISVRIGFALALPISLFLVIFGKPFLEWVYGAQFSAGYGPLMVLVAAQLSIAAFGSIGTLMNMTNHEALLTRILTVSALSNVALNFVLIPLYGLYGAAFATLASLVASNLLVVYHAHAKLGISSHILASARK